MKSDSTHEETGMKGYGKGGTHKMPDGKIMPGKKHGGTKKPAKKKGAK